MNDLHSLILFLVLGLIGSAQCAELGSPTSVLGALLGSSKTEMMELVDKANLLKTLESAAAHTNLTVLAPRGDFFDRHLDPGLRTFLVEPRNVKLLQRLVLSHVIPLRITAAEWKSRVVKALSGDEVHLHWKSGRRPAVGRFVLDIPDMITGNDGVAHRIDGLLVPKPVEDAYVAARMKMHSFSAVLPESAPSVSGHVVSRVEAIAPSPAQVVTFPLDDMSPAPSPAPLSGSLMEDEGEKSVREFLGVLARSGTYGEFCDLLENLTSMSAELKKMINRGRRVTVLVPEDVAIGKITTEEMRWPGLDDIVAQHVLSEYETEESLYSVAKRVDKVVMRSVLGKEVVAREVEGSVELVSGKSTGVLLDANIYLDDWISAQGINAVLIPP